MMSEFLHPDSTVYIVGQVYYITIWHRCMDLEHVVLAIRDWECLVSYIIFSRGVQREEVGLDVERRCGGVERRGVYMFLSPVFQCHLYYMFFFSMQVKTIPGAVWNSILCFELRAASEFKVCLHLVCIKTDLHTEKIGRIKKQRWCSRDSILRFPIIINTNYMRMAEWLGSLISLVPLCQGLRIFF